MVNWNCLRVSEEQAKHFFFGNDKDARTVQLSNVYVL